MQVLTPKYPIIPLKDKVFLPENFGFASTIGSNGLLQSVVSNAINKEGEFVNDLVNTRLDTSAKTILGDFTFGASGALKMITDVDNGLWISPTGILAKKIGATTFAIGIDGSPTFVGTMTATAGAIGGWSLSATAIYYDGATDVLSAGMATADYPFYAGKKYADRATAPFRVTPAGIVYATGAVIDGTSTLGGRLGSTIASAINSSGNFIDANLSTATKQILGEFTFGDSGALAIATDANNGLWLSPTGILGKKAGATTFAIGIDGTATFAGTLAGASGTFGTITAGAISGVTITGSTLTTGTVGANVAITASRISQRTGTTEVVYSDVGTYGGWWGFKDIDGNSAFYIDVEGSGTAHTIGFRGATTNSGDWIFDCKGDITFVGDTGNDVYPATDNAMMLGLGSNRWADVRSVLINGADYCFENGVRITEEKDFGISFYNKEDKKIMTLDDEGNLWVKGKVKNNTDFKKQFPFYRKGLIIKE